MAEGIIRADPDEDGPTFMLARATAQDERLTWEARGLLAYMHSLPRDWRLNPADLIKRGKGGRNRIYRMLSELREAGYILRTDVRDEHGKIVRWEYLARMRPLPRYPDVADPDVANGHSTEVQTDDSKARQSKDNPPSAPLRRRASGDAPAAAEQMRRIFEAWKAATGRNGTTGYDNKRKAAIKGRLGEGFTADQLVAAVEAIPRSDFHNGRDPKTRDHDRAQLARLTELTLHLRDAAHVEYLLALAGTGGSTARGAEPGDPRYRPDYIPTDEELIAQYKPEGI